ncbi:CorA family divalent cation transporter [Sphingomonas koreensis]
MAQLNHAGLVPDQASLAPVWRRLRNDDAQGLRQAVDDLGCRFPPPEEGYEEDAAFIYLPVSVLVREDHEVRQDHVVFALGEDVLVTREPADGFAPFDRALAILRRRPGIPRTAHGVMYALLQAANSASNQILELASAALEGMNRRIRQIGEGYDDAQREITTDDIADTMAELNDREELVSRILESQLLLARAARYLRAEADGSDSELRGQIETLISDIQSIKEHAGFEHDKVRYLQQSVMTSLNVRQNQVVKVFTIITAVFLPPTLIATFYGMNFSVMPELSWEWGFTATILLTLLAALLPLWYIKRKGWLR